MRPAPTEPFIPEAWHGRPVVGIVACHTGDPLQAARDLAPIRALGTPIADRIGHTRYVDVQSMLDRTQPAGMYNYWKSEFLPHLPVEIIPPLREHAARIASPMSQILLFQLGGALADCDAGATPFDNRDATHIFFAAGCWPPDSPDGERHRAWVRSAWEAIRPYSTGGNYVNVQTEDEDESRMRGAYRDGLERLANVKTAYDPDNLFRVNRNILPGPSLARG